MTTERWNNKVVDAPSPFRASNDSHKKHIEAINKYSSLDTALGGPYVAGGLVSTPQTPTRRAPGVFASVSTTPVTASSGRRSSSPYVESPMSILNGEERHERYSRRMVSPHRHTRGGAPDVTDLYSRRMSPRRHEAASPSTLDRPLSVARTDVIMDRGRMHSPSHRNYSDTVSNHLHGGLGMVAATSAIGIAAASASVSPIATGRPSSRPSLKNAESTRLESGHWKPTINKRCTASQPTLVGVMKPLASQTAAPYRVIPPFGIS
jgi:hypothetical protein